MGNDRIVLIEREGATATIWMNRPERLNVLTLAMLEALTEAFDNVGSSDATGIVLGGKGRLFSAGHDFGEMLDQDLDTVRHLFDVCATLMATMQAVPQPVVARVQGLATGAGCQLVACADLAIASCDAAFCAPGGRGGLFCTTPMVAIGRTLSRKRALEMAMSGDPIDAATAESWGLVNEVVEVDDLDAATVRLLARVTRGSTVSKALGKRAFYEQMDMAQRSAYEYASEVMAVASQSPDAQEGIRAFIEKRPPQWSGAPPDRPGPRSSPPPTR